MYFSRMTSYSYTHWNDEDFVETATATTSTATATATATTATVTAAAADTSIIVAEQILKRKYTREERLRHEANRLEQERKDEEEEKTRIANASDPNAIAERAASIAYLHHLDTTPWSLNF